ncbi:hypothetical protein A0H81_07334 [Grifola frondosa]|uniref:Uncharacterized protein n=1 Tax=Grifola frondosa TaxID=5627 RepID=A0A1C7M7I0_GRIFR|nr:hypothetical protein A0H81_07334 [Grifola frondosa]
MPPGRLTVRSLSSPSAQSSKLAMSNSDAAAEIVAEYDFILQANCYQLTSRHHSTVVLQIFFLMLFMTMVISSRTCLIASDALVLAVTWSKTYQLRKAAQQAQVKASLLTLLLRDGTIYFVVLLILNALHIVFNFVEQVPFVSIFADAFTSILISRFILNLREVDIHVHGGMRSGRATFDGSMSYQSQPDTIIFTSNNNFVDSIGAPLDHGFPSVDEDGAAAISTAQREHSCDLLVYQLPPMNGLLKRNLPVDLDSDMKVGHTSLYSAYLSSTVT